ncbi:hypothetical protein FRC00_008037, partial [Tulasnella sp. 408]
MVQVTTLFTVLAVSSGAVQAAVPLWFQVSGILVKLLGELDSFNYRAPPSSPGPTYLNSVDGAYCEVLNQYESQCVPIRSTTTKPTTTTTTTQPAQSLVPLWYQCG